MSHDIEMYRLEYLVTVTLDGRDDYM